MSLLRELGPKFGRLGRATASERIVGQCRTLWAQRNLSEMKIEELCDELEEGLAQAAENGYDPKVVTGHNVRKYAEDMAEMNAPLKRRVATAYKMSLTALVSICAVLVPQHVLLSSWTVPAGWPEIASIVAIFSVIGLLQWHRFSSVIYNGRRVEGIFFACDVWAFAAGLLIGMTLQVSDFEPAATQLLGWPWWASTAIIGLALLVSRLHRLSTDGPVSPRVGTGQERCGPGRNAKVALAFALVAFSCNLISWLTADGLSEDWSTLMLIASTLLLATILPAFGRRAPEPPVFG